MRTEKQGQTDDQKWPKKISGEEDAAGVTSLVQLPAARPESSKVRKVPKIRLGFEGTVGV